MEEVDILMVDTGTQDERKVYVVAGAYGGVGGALVSSLSSENARVAVVGRDPEKLTALALEANATAFCADLSDFQQTSECIEKVLSTFGRIDGAVCLCGSLAIKPAHQTSREEWNRILSDNLTTAFSLVRSCAKAMTRTGGSIVLVSSAAARTGLPNHDAIAAAKAGVEGLARASAATYSRYNIRVNCVAPGMLDTKLSSAVTSKPDLLAAALHLYGIKRVGTAQEVASTIQWLLSPESGWITGQVIVIDGGLSSLKFPPLVRTSV